MLLTVMLHLAASMIVIVAGSVLFNTGYVVFYFALGIALLQWLYLVPAARIARSKNWPGVARGIWIAGSLTVALSLLQYVLMFSGGISERLTGNTRPNTFYAGRDSVVVAADATHIEVRVGVDGRADPVASNTEIFLITAETTFDFRGPAQGQETSPGSVAWLKPGRQVSVEYVFRNHQKEARLVSIWLTAPEPAL